MLLSLAPAALSKTTTTVTNKSNHLGHLMTRLEISGSSTGK